MVLRLLLLGLLTTSVGAVKSKATPIEKVIELLKGLQTKVTEEGKKEAAAYDKFACFCKEQADEKLYAIEKSNALISELGAQIEKLNSEISALNNDIGGLSQKASKLEAKIDAESKARAKDHAAYLVKAKDLNEAIDACGAAIEAMKDAKKGLKDAKVDFAQVSAQLLGVASRQRVSPDALALVQQLAKHKQAPAKYTFQGNDIIASLQDLLATFKEMKKSLDEDEFDVNSVFEKEALGDSNELKFANKEKDEKAALSEEKTEELMNAREAKTEEEKDRKADQSFLDTLTGECEEKAKLFDQRSSTRADELTAMTKAIALLEDGVKPNEGANKKLVGLVQGASFLQIRTLQQDSNRAVARVQQLLQEAASQQDSVVLRNAATRVQLSKDHFVKVRALIKDLIAKLKADAEAEADQKSFCDKAMKKATTNRDEGKAKSEAAGAKLATLTSQKEQLTAEIADLTDKIAQNKKAINEATELRDDERADNEETLREANQGLEAVNMALSVLNNFYKNAFVQTSKYVPPKSDRDGNTVGDLAPDTFDEDYHGSQGESKGIIGIMEIIASDFDRTIKKVEAEEKTAQAAFDKFTKETNDDTDTMQKTVGDKDTKVKETEGDIVSQQQELKDATALFESAEEKLAELNSSCVEGEETWEERAAARKKEIEALKDAMAILDEWQG